MENLPYENKYPLLEVPCEAQMIDEETKLDNN